MHKQNMFTAFSLKKMQGASTCMGVCGRGRHGSRRYQEESVPVLRSVRGAVVMHDLS